MSNPKDSVLSKFLSKYVPSKTRRKDVNDFVSHLTFLIESAILGSKVHLFGSTVTGLDLLSSDVDIVVIYCIDSLALFEQVLLAISNEKFRSILPIRDSKIPIIKIQTKNGISCDITFNRKAGIESSQLTKQLTKKYVHLAQLGRLLKIWKTNRCLPGSRVNGLSNFSWILLITYFFQKSPKQGNSLAEILLNLFEFYLNFDLSTVISIRETKNIITRESNNWNIPLTRLCIEDPTNIKFSVTKALEDTAWNQIYNEFIRGYLIISISNLNSNENIILDLFIDSRTLSPSPNIVYFVIIENKIEVVTIKSVNQSPSPIKSTNETFLSMTDIHIIVQIYEETNNEYEFRKTSKENLINPCQLILSFNNLTDIDSLLVLDKNSTEIFNQLKNCLLKINKK